MRTLPIAQKTSTEPRPSSFPVLTVYHDRELQALDCPRSIPWSVIEPHEEQAQRNHYQTLERLAERGGLDPREMVAVLTDRNWREVAFMTLAESVTELKLLLQR